MNTAKNILILTLSINILANCKPKYPVQEPIPLPLKQNINTTPQLPQTYKMNDQCFNTNTNAKQKCPKELN